MVVEIRLTSFQKTKRDTAKGKKMITAHGAVYGTPAEANARIAELNEENARIGASDGRVTEILLITEAMYAEGWEQAPRAREAARQEAASRRPKTPKLSAWASEQIMKAEQELAQIKRSGYDDGQWRYLKTQDDAGRIKVRREYKTQAGFLTAFVREVRRGHDILIAE